MTRVFILKCFYSRPPVILLSVLYSSLVFIAFPTTCMTRRSNVGTFGGKNMDMLHIIIYIQLDFFRS